ncbi:PhzF family phenazine biosynthesis protein [Halomonas sp. V046]|uniref:PhzF family phenazine biosynthesis protein n=1 Tax=Halomonas sp. V046 TaxID=3459611 RepID=UPI0040450EAB
MLPSLKRYYLLDVFTATPLAGNQLAVFLDADGMETERMQALACELNLAETVFVGRAQGEHRFSMRIFTRERELPFAGHPTVGAAQLLAAQGLVDASQISAEKPLILQVPAGALAVTFEGPLARFRAAQPVEVGASSLGHAAAAGLAGLELDEIASDPVQASCGLAFHLVPLASRQALARLTLDSAEWARHVSPSGIEQAYFYVQDGGTIEARMFSHHRGAFCEDPATGSAAVALAGYLGSEAKANRNDWRIRQGEAMGRPSEIHARASRDENGKVTVEIAGQAVLVGEGAFYPNASRGEA